MKHPKHGFTHTHIEHHPDGSHTMHHHHVDPEMTVEHAVPDHAGMMESMKEHLAEGAEPAAAPPMAASA